MRNIQRCNSPGTLQYCLLVHTYTLYDIRDISVYIPTHEHGRRNIPMNGPKRGHRCVNSIKLYILNGQ